MSVKDEIETRTIVINDVKADTINEAIARISILNDEEIVNAHRYQEYRIRPISMIINSHGGSVYEGLALIGAMEMSVVPIEVFVLGSAMSMGLVIAATGHKRIAHRYATFMYHEVSSGHIGKLSDQKLEQEEVERLQKVLDEHLIDRTGMTQAKLDEIKSKRHDWYFTAQEALELGVIDEVVDEPIIRSLEELEEREEEEESRPQTKKKVVKKKAPRKKIEKKATSKN